MYSYFEEVWGIRNRHMVKDLPHPYVFTLLPRKAKDRPHPRYEENGNSDDGNTWFPGSPPLSYFPIPIADPKRPWGSGACEQCGDKCAGHYLCPEEHHDFYQTHGRQGMKIKPPPSHCWHWSEETLEEGLQSIWWRKTSTCKGNTLNWRKCWNVATTPLGCVHQKKIIKVTPKGVPRKYRSFVGNDVFCFCGQGDYGEMIACDSPICPVEWFHLDCLGLSCAPEGEWFWQTMSF